jgi:alpha-L-fucosidase
VWFDGANGEGPNGRKQVYDWPRFWGHVKKLQPNAVIFSDAGPDVRWCGNERGTAGDPNWSTVDPAKVPYPGADGPGIIDALQHGDRDGAVWRPAEVDVSIRPGWFYHAAEDARVRSVDNLVDLYCTSVGRNGKLLLNVPPTTEGLIHATDAGRLAGMRDALDKLFSVQLAPTSDVASWSIDGTEMWIRMDLREPAAVSLVRLGENIERGQVVSSYSLSGEGLDGVWRELSRGTTIGHTKIDRFPPTMVKRVRFSVHDLVGDPLLGVWVY